jgi:hypothetical protein
MEKDQKRIEELVERVFALNQELHRLIGDESEQALGPPATEEQIEKVEKAFAIELPEDYRAFLRLHNGWREFSGGNSLLSTQEMLGGELRDSIDSLKQTQRENGEDEAAAGFVIEASLDLSRTFYDPATRGKDGRMELVYWRNEELDRFPSFTEYLETYAADLEEMIDEEKRKLRKKG